MPTTIEQEAHYAALLPHMDGDFLAWLKAQARQALLEELRPQAEAEAWAKLETTLATREEQLQARYAAQGVTLNREFEGRVEQVQAEAQRQAERAVEAQVNEWQATATKAESRLAAAEGPLVALVRALLPADGARVYLASRGVAELDVYGLNGILSHHGLRIAHDLPSQEVPELVVKVRTAEAHWDSATRAWLEPYEPPQEPRDPATGIPLKNIVYPT